jgi:hypothetical protein
LSSQAPRAHACNPSYSGGRDQEDLSSKPARETVCKNLSWEKKKKNLSQKRASGVAQGVGPELQEKKKSCALIKWRNFLNFKLTKMK